MGLKSYLLFVNTGKAALCIRKDLQVLKVLWIFAGTAHPKSHPRKLFIA